MAKDAEKLDAQAQRIRELRKFARVSQEIVAGAVGVTLRGYQRWERGEGEINPENIKKLAGYFSTTPDYIEYGVMERDREATPEPSAAGNLDRRLARLEEKIDRLLAGQADGARLTAREHADLDRWEHVLDRVLEVQQSELAPPRSSRARRPRRAAGESAA